MNDLTNRPAFESSFRGKRVLVTGHTGFKGGWLSLWLKQLGAEIFGIALEPETDPNLFETARVEDVLDHRILDIRNKDALFDAVTRIDPEIIFHLAAQPLVRRSYREPLETFEVNILGTANLLEACRQCKSAKAGIFVTTDKVYRNHEWIWPYRETDELGGGDPYSASKAAAEIIVSCYRQTMATYGNNIALVTARGGNIIGGGDWSEDRLVPDMVRAISNDASLTIRNPQAKRPWQHVLSLCHGYLLLAHNLIESPEPNQGEWNFGPLQKDVIEVETLLKLFANSWKSPLVQLESSLLHETQILSLDSTKARTQIGWNPAWDLQEAISKTAGWYRHYYENKSAIREVTDRQIEEYRRAIG